MSNAPQYVRGEEGIEALYTGQQVKQESGGIVPRFFIHRVAREDGTLHEMECVELTIPGDLKSSPINKVTDRERQRFPREYDAWKNGEGMTIDGTALELFLGRGDPRIADLRYHKIMSVELLANMSDTHVQNLGMGYMELRNNAKAYIASRTGTVALSEQIEQMKKQIESLTAAAGQVAPVAVQPVAVAPSNVTKISDTEPGFTIVRGYAGKFNVQDASGTVVFDVSGPGAKTKAQEWINSQS